MDTEETVQDAQVVTPVTPVVNPSVEAITANQTAFKAQLEAARKEMVRLQQEFEKQKSHALKLEGAIEASDLILKSLSK